MTVASTWSVSRNTPLLNHIINMFVGKRIAKVMSQMQPGLQKCHYLPNYRCEVDRKELRGSVSQIVSVSVIVSGARLEFKRGVIGVQATSPQQPARGIEHCATLARGHPKTHLQGGAVQILTTA